MKAPRQLLRRVRGTADVLYGRFALRYHLRLWTWWRHGRHHVAPIDPFRTLWVDPASIGLRVDLDRAYYMRIRLSFGVLDGDWDLAATPIEEHFVLRSLRAHFEEGVPWEHTPLHEYAMAGVRGDGPAYHRSRTEAEVRQRLDDLEHLFEGVRHHGYRSQQELEQSTHTTPLHRRRRRPAEFDEIVVHVDRAGRFVFVDGIHRLSVAKVLSVPLVPVCVLHRHAEWQEHRDAVARDPTAFPPETFEHPDLAALAPPTPRRSS